MDIRLYLKAILVLAKKCIIFVLSEKKDLTGSLICHFAYYEDPLLFKYFLISGRFTIHKQQSDMVALF